MKKLLPCILFYIVSNLSGFAQNRNIDSLKRLLKIEKEDSSKVKTLTKLAFSIYGINPDSTILISQQAKALALKIGWHKGEAEATNKEGIGNWVKGNYPKAIDCFTNSLKMGEEIDDKLIEGENLGDLGIMYDEQGNYPVAIDYFMKSLKIEEKIDDKELLGKNLGNLASVFYEQGDYPQAIDYNLKALKLAEETNNKQLQAMVLSNVGGIYHDEQDNAKAIEYDLKASKLAEETGNMHMLLIISNNIGIFYYNQHDCSNALNYDRKALKLAEKLGDKLGQSNNLSNIGQIYFTQKNYDSASDYEQKALGLVKETGDKHETAERLANIGVLYTKTGNFKEAEGYLKEAISIDSTIGQRYSLSADEEYISNLFDTTGRYKPALIYYKKAMILKDTLFNIDKNKALTRKEVSYEFEKKEAIEKAEQDGKVKKQKIITYGVSGGLLLVLLFTVSLFRSLRISRRKTQIIMEQKAEVEKKNILIQEKNKDILDSITYAKRLQDAILPPLGIIKKYLPESFIFYKPKDIVAGDFYWMERSGDTLLIAAADCTGHGVPGALVSVVCSNALNRAVKEFHITEPGKILDKVRELVLETFEKSENNVQDGMDISLCCINTKTKEAQWSGAYNLLWYIRNGELNEIIGDKQPIGKNSKPTPFNTHNVKLQRDDTLYFFTDGYADQFGGPKGKKFKYKQLQDVLLANASLSMDEQKTILETHLDKWKGDLEQVDDILVMGIRI